MSGRINWYGLLYCAEDNPVRNANLRGSVRNPIDIYLKCASLLAKSMEAQGESFAVISNAAAALGVRCKELNIYLPRIETYAFSWNVPREASFFSAHFKLELITAFSLGQFGGSVGLVDIDTVLHRPFRLPTLAAEGLLAYDISDQVFSAYGRDKVVRDLELVAGRTLVQPSWYGGEFIVGEVGAFRRFVGYLDECWQRYKSVMNGLHHVGDEMVTSAALNLARLDGQIIQDVGEPGGVVRWWTSRTRNVQPNFSAVADRSLLHLPADKEYLAQCSAVDQFSGDVFTSGFRQYAKRQLDARRLYNLVAPLLRRQRWHVAAI